jgi:hypothetical protein
MNTSSHTHIVRFMTLRHEIILVVGVPSRVILSCVPLPVRKLGGETLFLISDANHNF